MATGVASVSKSEISEEELLAGLSTTLHEMSQPMTVLLCALEYAAGLESSAEMKEMIGAGAEACARLSATVHAMQMQVKGAAERDGG